MNEFIMPDGTLSTIPFGMASQPDGELTAFELESYFNKTWIQHGEPGHTGHRCIPCAMEGPNPVMIFTPEQLIDSHQNNVLDWNEECDKNVQDHLIYCPGGQSLAKCDLGHYPMPAKPTLPVERIR